MTLIKEGSWQVATLRESKLVASNTKSFIFQLLAPMEREAGMHCDIRLTAPNGYQAERSYSIASAPEDKGIVEFGIALADKGEVSTYMWSLKAGAQLELRGPIGRHFIWRPDMPGPLYLVAGGSGITPLISMFRHYLRQGADPLRSVIVFLSARDFGKVAYREEMEKAAKDNPNIRFVITLTDFHPENWTGYTRRLDEEMLREVFPMRADANVYVCGPTAFVEAAASLLVHNGYKPEMIKTERFG